MFQVAVKIATVVAARPKGGSYVGSRRVYATWAGLAEHPGLPASRSGRTLVSVRSAVSRRAGERALQDPDLAEQRAGVRRGFLVVLDPGGDEHSR